MHPANGCVYKRKMASNYITSFLQSFRKKKKKMYMLFRIMILTTRGSSLVLVPLFTTAATSINNK